AIGPALKEQVVGAALVAALGQPSRVCGTPAARPRNLTEKNQQGFQGRGQDQMQTKQAISRRNFLQGMAAAAALSQRSTPSSFWAQTPSSSPEKLFVLPYSQVKLTG